MRSKPARSARCCLAVVRRRVPRPAREVAEVWDVVGLPDTAARDTDGIIEAACSGEIDALVIGGVDPADLRHPGVEEALAKTFVVSLEIRNSR